MLLTKQERDLLIRDDREFVNAAREASGLTRLDDMYSPGGPILPRPQTGNPWHYWKTDPPRTEQTLVLWREWINSGLEYCRASQVEDIRGLWWRIA